MKRGGGGGGEGAKEEREREGEEREIKKGRLCVKRTGPFVCEKNWAVCV